MAAAARLWEGRYRATVLQAERYLLPCMVYIDLNPVRAGLVAEARLRLVEPSPLRRALRTDRFLSPHPLYWTLGNTPFAREAAYAERVRSGIGARDQQVLTESALQGWAAGDDRFRRAAPGGDRTASGQGPRRSTAFGARLSIAAAAGSLPAFDMSPINT